MRYFVYRHVRLDYNEVFYVGIGTKPAYFHNIATEYSRAFQKTRRSVFWNNVISKTAYKVEILFETNNRQSLYQKEKEFIKLYGRKDLKTGSLVNLTSGGTPGLKGCFYTKSKKKRLSVLSYWRGKFGKLHPTSRIVYAYLISGKFKGKYSSLRECARKLKVRDSGIQAVLKKNYRQSNGYRFYYTFRGERIKPLRVYGHIGIMRSVAKLNTKGKVIRIFSSMALAGKSVNRKDTSIRRACLNKSYTCGGYFWKYLK